MIEDKEGRKIFRDRSTIEYVIKDGMKKRKYPKRDTYYSLNEVEKKRISDGKMKSDRLSKNWVINFGKYKGTKMKDMVSKEQYDYCVWAYSEMKEKMNKSEKKKERKYKAFSWAVRNNKGY